MVDILRGESGIWDLFGTWVERSKRLDFYCFCGSLVFGRLRDFLYRCADFHTALYEPSCYLDRNWNSRIRVWASSSIIHGDPSSLLQIVLHPLNCYDASTIDRFLS